MMGLRQPITLIKSLQHTFRTSFFSIFWNLLFYSSRKGIMQAQDMILRIYEAEQQSSLSIILDNQLFDKSYYTSFRCFSSSSILACESGLGMQIILLNLLFAAESSYFGRFVAPITRISPFLGLLIPSIKTRNSVFNLLDASFQFYEREVSIESIQSIKIMEGANFSAAAKIFFMVFQDYPTSLFKMDDADNAKNVQPDYLANALQIQVFPLPGGPQSRIPLGGARMPVQRSGLCLGRMTASQSMALTSVNPEISLNETSRFLTIRSSIAGSSIFYSLGFLNIGGFFLSLQIYFMWISSLLFVLNYGILIALKEFEAGNPKPGTTLNLLSCFSLFFAQALLLSAINFYIFAFSWLIVSCEVAYLISSLRRKIILSQQRMAYQQFPQEIKLQAFKDNYLACPNFYITIIKQNQQSNT